MPGALTVVAQDAEKITVDMVAAAAKLAGLTFPPEVLQNIANQFSSARGSLTARYQNIRAMNIPNSLQPALVFNPIPSGMRLPTLRSPLKRSQPKVMLPESEDVPFNWDATADVRKLRVGYLKSRFEREIVDDPQNPNPRAAQQREQKVTDDAALAVIRSLGIELKPIELPQFPDSELGFVLSVESAAAFADITRNNQVESMLKPPESSSGPGPSASTGLCLPSSTSRPTD